MAESEVLVAQKRQGRGTKLARRLRDEGSIPAVVYGHKQDTLSLAITRDDLMRVIRHGARVVDLKTDAGVEKALIRDLQWDHLGKEVLHVDFARVSEDERIHVPVKIELRGIAAGVTGGGVLDQQLHMLQVECLAISIPETIRVNIAELQIGSAIHVKELTLPPDVKALDDPDAVVVHVTTKLKVEEAPVAAPTEPTSAEPEVIGRVKEEGEKEE